MARCHLYGTCEKDTVLMQNNELVDCPRCLSLNPARDSDCVLCDREEQRTGKVPPAMAVEYALHLGRIQAVTATQNAWWSWSESVKQLRDRHNYREAQWMDDEQS